MPNREGVKYLKISKTDAGGVDRTSTLQQLRNIRMNYSDVGVVQYDVKSTSEYSTYFLYRVDYVNPTSSIDRGVLNYVLSSTATAGPSVVAVNASASVTGYDNSTTFFNSTTGLYTFSQRLPNTTITFTASAQAGPVVPGAFQPYVRLVLTGSSFTRTVISQSQAISPVTADTGVTVSGSFVVPAEDAQYYIEVANGSAGSVPCAFSTVVLKVSQSIASTGNTAIITTPSPDTVELFTGTDCDVTYGVADQYPSSQYYMQADYSTGILVPTNFQQIVSQSAVLAAVQDYYYVLKRQTKPRYEGSRTNTYRINEYTGPSDSIIIDGYPYEGDTGYIKDPGIENRKVYFGWFQEVFGATPEVNNAVNVNIKYLINEASGTFSPDLVDFFLGELRDTFQQGENLELNFIDAKDGTNSTPTAIKRAMSGLLPIYRSGVKAVPILYSQTGSSGNAYTSSLTFNLAPGVQAQAVSGNFGFAATTSSITEEIPAGQTQVKLSNVIYDYQGNYNSTTGVYKFNATPASAIAFTFSGKVQHKPFIVSQGNTQLTLELKKNSITLVKQVFNIDRKLFPEPINIGVNTLFSDRFFTNDEVTVQVTANNNSTYFTEYGLTLGQSSLALPFINNSIPITASYFFSNSIDLTILTASAQFAPILGNTSQIDIPNSGFDSILNQASFNVGDQLRFENDENKVFTINRILSSSTQTSNKETYLLLDRPMIPGTNLNYFLLRRFEDDPTNIIVQAIKPAGGTGAGSIKPQYISKTLNKNLGQVVQKLQQQNTI